MIFMSCESLNDPYTVAPEQIFLKSQTKWNTNTNSNAKENILEYISYDKSGKILESINYHQNGNISSRSQFDYEGNLGEELTKFFDVNGELINSNKSKYQYNNGLLVEKVSLDSDGSAIRRIVYDYNSSGELIKKVEFDVINNSSNELRYSYDYNESGNVVTRTINDLSNSSIKKDSLVYGNDFVDVFQINNGNFEVKTTIHYNRNGLVTTEVHTNSQGKVVKRFVYDYEFY